MQDIIKELQELPGQIEEVELYATKLRKSAKALRSDMSEREIVIITAATAKEWGSNAEERKINQGAALGNDPAYSALSDELDDIEIQMAAAEIRLSFLRNSFSAARSIAALMAKQ